MFIAVECAGLANTKYNTLIGALELHQALKAIEQDDKGRGWHFTIHLTYPPYSKPVILGINTSIPHDMT